MAQLTSKQKFLLHQMMWHRCLSKPLADDLLRTVSDSSVEFDAYIRPINAAIAIARMKIAKGIDEESGCVHYAVVNLADNHLSRQYALYSQEQLKVLHRALCLIATEPTNTFHEHKLLDASYRVGTKLTKTQMISFLLELVDQRFLRRTDDGLFTLGVRGCIELEPYFRMHHSKTVEDCNACKAMCMRGEHCNNCDIKLHLSCLRRCMDNLDGVCPNCEQLWVSRPLPSQSEQSSLSQVRSQRQVTFSQSRTQQQSQDLLPSQQSASGRRQARTSIIQSQEMNGSMQADNLASQSAESEEEEDDHDHEDDDDNATTSQSLILSQTEPEAKRARRGAIKRSASTRSKRALSSDSDADDDD